MSGTDFVYNELMFRLPRGQTHRKQSWHEAVCKGRIVWNEWKTLKDSWIKKVEGLERSGTGW